MPRRYDIKNIAYLFGLLLFNQAKPLPCLKVRFCLFSFYRLEELCMDNTNYKEASEYNMQQTFRIIDEDGIHARPATALINTASKFSEAASFAEAGGKRVTLKSILGLLSMGLETGDTLTLITEGTQAAEALAALQEVMIKEGLGELHE